MRQQTLPAAEVVALARSMGKPKRAKAKAKKAAMSEKDFQRNVIDLAHKYGWRVAHFRKVRVQRGNGSVYWETPAAADGKGFFDLVLVRDRIIFAELKTDTGATKIEQRIWADATKLAGGVVYEWRPRDWSQIVEVLGVKP